MKISSSQPINRKEREALRLALSKNERFFGFKLSNVSVTICHSKIEWKRASRYYYFPFARGVVLRDGSVVLKSPRLGETTLTQWSKIATHELNHSYWRTLRGGGRNLWCPIWLVEGLACLVARNDVVRTQSALQRSIKGGKFMPALPYRYRASLFPDRNSIVLNYTFLDTLPGLVG